jgi:hypothetical protein
MILPPDDGLLRRRLAAPQNDPFLCFFSPKLGMLLGAPNKWIFTLWLLNIAMQKYPFIDDLS